MYLEVTPSTTESRARHLNCKVDIKFQNDVANKQNRGRRASFVAAFERVEKAADNIKDVNAIQKGGLDFYDPAEKFYPSRTIFLKQNRQRRFKSMTMQTQMRRKVGKKSGVPFWIPSSSYRTHLFELIGTSCFLFSSSITAFGCL